MQAHSEEPRRRRVRWRRLAALLLGVALAGLAGELVLRVAAPAITRRSGQENRRFHYLAANPSYAETYVADPVLGWRNAPSFERHFRRGGVEFVHRINSLGMHSPECEPRPGPDVFRIVWLGDSQAITQVNLEDSHPYLTERCLNESRAPGDPRYEVLNLGVAGYGFSQYLSMLERGALDLEPDLVLVQVNPGNDYYDELPQIMDYLWGVPARYVLEGEHLVARRAPLTVQRAEPSELHTALYDHVASYRCYANLMVRAAYRERDGFLRSAAERLGVTLRAPGVPMLDLRELQQELARSLEPIHLFGEGMNRETWTLLQSVQAILARMQELARAAGAELAILANPHVKGRRFRTDSLVAEMAERLGTPFLDVLERIPDHVEPGVDAFAELTFYPEIDDSHFDRNGNRVLAAIVCDWLLGSGLLERADRPATER